MEKIETVYPVKKSFSSRIKSKITHPERRYYNKFFSNINHPEPSKGKILMYVALGGMYLTPLEILMYHLFRDRGYEVDYMMYDETVPLNEVITKERVEREGKDKFWNRAVRKSNKILASAKVEWKTIDIDPSVPNMVNKINSAEELYKLNYENVGFGEIVRGAMYRYYKSLKFDADELLIAKQFLTTALTNYFKFKQLVTTNKYDQILFSHGIYSTWEPIVQYCELNGINFVCYDRAKTKAHCNFNFNKPSPVWDISKAWERWGDYSLSDEELLKVDNYLKERELQKGDVYAYNFSEKISDLDLLRQKLKIAPNAKVITIFTNLIWDAANVSRDIAFSSPLECIKETISRYASKEGVHVLIRTHPAEKVLGTSEQYGKLVRNLFSQLPKNVTIVEPEDDINSFSIMDVTTVGVVHTSTVGLELAIEGKPVILISDTHYRGKGFTYDATSQEHYFGILDAMLENLPDVRRQVELAKKYFYIMMFEYQHKMPLTFTETDLFNGYGYSNFGELISRTMPLNMILDRAIAKNAADDFIFDTDKSRL